MGLRPHATPVPHPTPAPHRRVRRALPATHTPPYPRPRRCRAVAKRTKRQPKGGRQLPGREARCVGGWPVRGCKMQQRLTPAFAAAAFGILHVQRRAALQPLNLLCNFGAFLGLFLLAPRRRAGQLCGYQLLVFPLDTEARSSRESVRVLECWDVCVCVCVCVCLSRVNFLALGFGRVGGSPPPP